MYDKSLHSSLVSFLQEAPRFYSEEQEVLKASPVAWNLFKETQKLVFLTFIRMATHKESKVLYAYSHHHYVVFSNNSIFKQLGFLFMARSFWKADL